jgi:DNA mismatch repair protein MLH3
VDVRRVDDLSFFGKDLLPGAISREMLGRCVCIGQVDTKFIACLCGNTLVLFDQHAADERIKLEQLTASTIANLREGLDSFACDPPLQFRATFEELDIVETYKDRLTSWGWRVETAVSSVNTNTPEECRQKNANVVRVSGVPCVDGRTLTLPDLREYIQQLGETCGARSMPKAVTYVLGSRSCRSAIKFGDRLTWEECSRLVDGIARARMPFQCAHGRPTCAPLVDVAKLRGVEETIAARKKKHHHQQQQQTALGRRKIDLRKLRRKCLSLKQESE